MGAGLSPADRTDGARAGVGRGDPGGPLAALGLSDPSERLYRALLRHPNRSPTQVARSAGLESAGAVAAAEELISLGLARRLVGSRRLVPAEPSAALGALSATREAALAQVRAVLPELDEIYREGRLLGTADQPLEVVTGRAEVARRTMEVRAAARTEVLTFDRPPYAITPRPDEMDREQTLLERSVVVRAIYSQAALEVPGRLPVVRELGAQGEQSRVLPDLPLKLLIVDAQTAITALGHNQQAAESIIVIRSSGLLDALVALFEALWAQATPIGAGPAADEAAPEDRALLVMLAAGLKDETIARQLDISPRTVRRRVAALCDRLNAPTRFQAGMTAVRRGWL